MIPFIGTTAGAACVFFLRGQIRPSVQKALLGFASGVMVAASVWSLLIPAMDMSESMGKFAFIPAAAGLLLGVGFLLGMDRLIPHLHLGSEKAEGPACTLKKTTMLVLAVTLHNIPEGMEVGVVFAGMLSDSVEITLAGAFALSVGIAIQNFPEGAIISLPLSSDGESRKKAFTMGTLSGIEMCIRDREQGWHDARIEPHEPISLMPACVTLHYAQETFEGMKAYRTKE